MATERTGVCTFRVWITGKRESFFVPLALEPGAWVWDGPGAFSKEPINFQNFHGLWMGLYPLVRLTGLFGPARPCASQQFGTEVAKGGELIPWEEQCCNTRV